jgi:hypothetical protein
MKDFISFRVIFNDNFMHFRVPRSDEKSFSGQAPGEVKEKTLSLEQARTMKQAQKASHKPGSDLSDSDNATRVTWLNEISDPHRDDSTWSGSIQTQARPRRYE